MELVSGFGLVEEPPRVSLPPESGKVDRSAQEVAGQLVQPLGVGGVDGGSIVYAETGMPPREEQVDALLGNEPSVLEKSENLVSEEELGSVFVDVGNGNPFAIRFENASARIWFWSISEKMAARLAPHEGRSPRPLQEKATRNSSRQLVHCTRAKPDSNKPQSRYLATAVS